MKEKLTTLRQLDRRLLQVKEAGFLVPKQGWVRTIRKALGMTIKQLAKRLQVDPSRVVKIETSEIEDAVTLRTLKSVATAFDCRLVYGFVPRQTFEEMLLKRAKQLAAEQVKRTAHTMDLESQSVDESWLEDQTKELTDELLRKAWKQLWED